MSLAALKKSILLQLLYSDIFRHPLTADELYGIAPETAAVIDQALQELARCGLVEQAEGYFAVGEVENKLALRKAGMNRARQLENKSLRIGRFIAGFPFVKGVGISGSLSKGILHADSDFDYFIITRHNRLWVARTLLILYKKIFLLNSRKYFCVNYFIDDQNLKIAEQNRFTATEIQTLIPVIGAVFSDFHRENSWIREFYPGSTFLTVRLEERTKSFLSRSLQWLLNGKLGERIDRWCMRITFRRWKKKFSYFQDEKFELTLRTRRYISKHHPNDFQTKVLNRHRELIASYKMQWHEVLKREGIEL